MRASDCEGEKESETTVLVSTCLYPWPYDGFVYTRHTYSYGSDRFVRGNVSKEDDRSLRTAQLRFRFRVLDSLARARSLSPWFIHCLRVYAGVYGGFKNFNPLRSFSLPLILLLLCFSLHFHLLFHCNYLSHVPLVLSYTVALKKLYAQADPS